MADSDGVVGWVPQGAIPDLDPLLFDPSMVLNALQGPVATGFGNVIFRVTSGPSVETLTAEMRNLVATAQFQEWMDARSTELISDLTLDIEDARWLLDHL